jgi:hypothetical protein
VKVLISKSNTFCEGFKVLDFDIKTFTEDRRYWTLILRPSQKTEGIGL